MSWRGGHGLEAGDSDGDGDGDGRLFGYSVTRCPEVKLEGHARLPELLRRSL